MLGTGTIYNGTFNGGVTNKEGAIISGGIFKGAVSNSGEIGGGTFSGTVKNYGTITDGSFATITYNSGNITSTNGSVTVNSLSSDYGTVTVNGTKHTHTVTEEYRYLNEDKHNVYSLCKNCPVNYVKSVEAYYHQPGHYKNISASELQDICPCNTVLGESIITAPAANTLTYDGTAKEATVNSTGTVYNCDTIIYTAGEGSELTDGVPVNAGTYTASVKISNKYSVSVSYTIAQISLAGCSITLSENSSYPYTGAAVTPVPTVTVDGRTLEKDKDYTVEYTGNNEDVTEENGATLTINGIGNYYGTASANFTIIPGTYTPNSDTYETTCGSNVTTVSFNLNELIPFPINETFSLALGEITATSNATTAPGEATGSIQENEAILTVTLPENKNAGDVFSIPVTVTTLSGNYAPYVFTFRVEVSAKKDRTLAWNHQSLRSLRVEYGDGKVIDLSDYIVLDTSEGSDLSTVTYSVAPGSTKNPSWTLNGSILTPGNAGDVLLTATLPGDDTYNDMTSTVFLYIEPAEAEGKIVFETITGEGKTLADVSWTADFKDKNGNPLSGTLIWDDVCDSLGNIVQPDSVAVEQGVWYAYEFRPTDLNYMIVRDTVCLYPEHSWTYSAQNNILTVECTDDGCDKKVTMTLEKASYCTGVYEPEALQGVVVVTSEGADSLFPNVYAIYEVKNAAGEYERLNDMMAPEPIDAGSYRAGITVGGVTAYLEYEIAPKPLTDETVSVTMASTEGTYTGSSQVMPELVVKDSGQELLLGDGKLIKDTDYTITYYRMVDGVKTETEDLTNVGEIYVEVTGIGNYTGSVEKTYTVNPKEVTNPVFSGLGSKYAYTGTEIKPAFTLMDGEKEIPYDDEWSYMCENNFNIGIATITIIDMPGGNYEVSGSASFEIVEHTHAFTYAQDTANANVLIATCQNEDVICDAAAITFTLTAPAEEELYYDGWTKEATLTQTPYFFDGITVKYTKDGIAVDAPNELGTYTAYLTLGEGDAAATASVTYTIKKGELPEKSRPYAAEFLTYELGRAVEACINRYNYVSDATYSFSTSTDGETWSEWTETMPTMTDVGTLYVKAKVTDSSRYNDFETEAALVTMQPFDLCNPTYSLVMGVSDVYYTGSEQEPEFSIFVRDNRQTDITEALKANCIITYANNIDITTEDSKAELIITGDGNYSGYIIAEFDIEQADITAVATTDTVTEAGEPNWKTEATITAPEGYTIGTQPGGAFDTTMTVAESSADETGTVVTYYLKQEETGYVSAAKTITVYVDAEAPKIMAIGQGQITETTAEISWTVTDNRAVAECKYLCLSAAEGADADNVLEGGIAVVGEAGEYSLNLTDLEADLLYYVHVAVRDELGNATMETITFTTASSDGAVTPGETPGVTPEVTPGVTVTPTPEVTPGVTVTPTPEVTPGATVTPTPEPTPTEAPTEAPTPTPEPTKKPSRPGGYHPSVWVTPEPTKAPKPTATPLPTATPAPTSIPQGTDEQKYNPENTWFAADVFEQAEKLYDVLLGTSAKEASLATTIQVGETIDLNFYGVKNWKRDNFTYQWTTSDESIATVDRVGKVTMLEEGVAIIRLELVEKATGKKLNVAPILVGVPEAVYDVFLGTSAKDVSIVRELMLGDTIDLNFYGVKNWKKEDYSYEWLSSDEDVATVDNIGIVTAKKPGVTIVRLKLTKKATGEVVKVAPVVLVVPEEKK